MWLLLMIMARTKTRKAAAKPPAKRAKLKFGKWKEMVRSPIPPKVKTSPPKPSEGKNSKPQKLPPAIEAPRTAAAAPETPLAPLSAELTEKIKDLLVQNSVCISDDHYKVIFPKIVEFIVFLKTL